MPVPETRTVGEIVRDTYTALDRRDFDAVRPLWIEDSVNHVLPLGMSLRGPREIEAFIRNVFAAVPDWRLSIENIVEDERHAVVQWSGEGTFDGLSFEGIEPSGRRLSLRGCDVVRLTADGTLEEDTTYFDGAEWARQVGLLPPRGSSLDKGITEAFNALTRLRRKLDA